MRRLLQFMNICLLSACCASCDRQDLNVLYRTAVENELMVKRLEKSVDDMNADIRNLRNLTDALMSRLYVTRPVERTSRGYILVFGNDTKADSIRVEISDARTPVIEIDPDTKKWKINGEDTGVPAVGKDGVVAPAPQVRIAADNCWEYSADGITWVKTAIKATGAAGENGVKPEISINENGNWTIGGQETAPPLKAWGKDGVDAAVPMMGIDNTVSPCRWKISLDGGTTWTTTEIVAGASDGYAGADGSTSPYIESVAVTNDTIIFTFDNNIPGTVPPTRVKKVLLNPGAKMSIKVLTTGHNVLDGQVFLFGLQETKVVRYELTGSDIVSVAPIHVPGFLKVTVNRTDKTLTLVSSGQSQPFSPGDNFFRLQAVNAKGEFVSTVVIVEPVEHVVIADNDFTKSGVAEVCVTGGGSIMEEYKLTNIPVNTDYYYCWENKRDKTSLDAYFNKRPFKTVIKPLTLTDIDGNDYALCRSISSVWMAEDLRVTHYNDGTPIANITNTNAWVADRAGASCYLNNDKAGALGKGYGLLYNGYAVSTGKLCPKGWHVATEQDWLDMEMWMERSNGFPDSGFEDVTGWRGRRIGYSLTWNPHKWEGSGYSSAHKYMLGLVPGGKRNDDGTYAQPGKNGYYWAVGDEGNMFYRWMEVNNGGVYRDAADLKTGMSVRCVRDIQ